MKLSFTRLSTVLVNVVPIIGIIFFNWSAFLILFTYWCETGVIVFWNIFKIWKTKISEENKNIFTRTGSNNTTIFFPEWGTRLVYVLLSVLLYSVFMTVHLLFLFFLGGIVTALKDLFTANSIGLANLSNSHENFISWLFIGNGITYSSVGIMIIGFFITHGFSYVENFLDKKQYLEGDLVTQMIVPFKRIAVLQFTIIISSFLFLFIPYVGGVFLVLLKLFFERKIFLKENPQNIVEVNKL